MSKNIGEYDELRIKLRLIQLRDKNANISIDGKSFSISSVRLDKDFLSLPKGTDLRLFSDAQIKKLANSVGAGKSKATYKADVLINGEGYSVKSHRSTPPAIVNHTPRWGWCRVCNLLGKDISKLDDMVNKYFDLRRKGLIKEDVLNSDHNSPFAKNFKYLKPILNYFLFKGTGAKDSVFPAKYVLVCKDPLDESTWEVYDEDNYLDIYWDRLKFSMRNKGFEAYPYVRDNDSWKNQLSKPWAKKIGGLYKGSLHIRVCK